MIVTHAHSFKGSNNNTAGYKVVNNERLPRMLTRAGNETGGRYTGEEDKKKPEHSRKIDMMTWFLVAES
jgi:hypothetical protein